MTDRYMGRQYRAAPSPPIGAHHKLSGVDKYRRCDREDGGPYQIVSTVAIDSTPDIPVRRKVRLICTRSGRLVRETWSDAATGVYQFRNIRRGPWTIITHDYTGTYNAVVADHYSADLP